MNNINAALLKDAYKAFHKFAYNPEVTHVYSNFTNRHGKYSNTKSDEVVFVGLQYFIKEILVKQWNDTFFSKPKEEVVGEYRRVIESMLGKTIDTKHMEDLHDLGYLPILVKALPEGSVVGYQIPTLTITNTVSGFGWVTNMLETVMSSELWGISTSATTAYTYRKRFEKEQSLKELGMIPFLGHDFSYRGMFGTQAAAQSGFGHLCSFVGSDTIPAALFAEEYYGAKIDKELVFASVDATEHSVMCSYGTEGEQASLEHLITNVTPAGIISVVSDTWDFWKLVTEYLPNLKDKIMVRDGTLVIRPDSGDPVEILCGKSSNAITLSTQFTDFSIWKEFVQDHLHELFSNELKQDPTNPFPGMTERYNFNGKIYEVTYEPDINRYDKTYYYVDNWGNFGEKFCWVEVELTAEEKGLIECLWDTFGGTIQESTGLKLLDSHIGAIYGDSITLERQDEIIKRLVTKGFVPSVVLGIGSYTYQYVTRDTHGSAVKATCVQKGEGNYEPIFKDPKTDKSKKSAKGLLMVTKEGGKFVLHSDVTPEQEQQGELIPVFKDGELLVETTLSEIRERINFTL